MCCQNNSCRKAVMLNILKIINHFVVGLIFIGTLNAFNVSHAASPVKKSPTKASKNTSKKRKYTDSFFASTVENKPRTEKELKLILSGLNTLLPIEKSQAKKNEMLISKSLTLLSLGKHYYLNDKLPQAHRRKEDFLRKAMQAAAEASNSKAATIRVKSKALHIYGMASLYVDNEDKAVEYFEHAIKIDPNSNLTPRLSLFIGEYYFDREKHEIALPYYSQFFTKLNPEEKALSIYKSAWCFLVLKQFENAEKAFLKIAGKSWAGDFGKDAIRDLAQTVTSYKTETQIIQFGTSFFTKSQPDLLIEFYTNCYMILLRQSGNTDLLALYNEIQRLETRPERKVALAIKKLTSHQKGYASLQVFKDINEIDTLIIQSALKPETDVFNYFASELELELQRSISAYVDTISKKIKTPENYSSLDLAGKLQKLLWYHVAWFPNSPKLSQTYLIAIDNCNFLKDPDCSLRVSRLILRQEKLKNVWPRARVEILLSLEILSSKDGKYKIEFENELKNYADTQEPAKDWLPFTKKLTSIYVLEKRYAESEPYLIKILAKENNVENLYRKMLCQFNLKKYTDVVGHVKQIPASGAYASEIKFLVRESSLSLAKEFTDKNDFNNYEKYLFQYLSLQPEPEKADIVTADYYNRLITKQDFAKVIFYYNKLPASKKFEGILSKPLMLLFTHLYSMNRFQEVDDILSKGSTFGQYREFDYYWIRSILAKNNNFNDKEFKVLSSAKPEYRLSVLSMAAVTKPELVQTYFKLYLPNNDSEKKVWLMSRQILQGEKKIDLTNNEIKVYNSVLSPEIITPSNFKSEKLIKLVEFPQPNWSQARLAKVTPDAMDRVKSIRSQIVRELKGQTIDNQKKLILNGINVEKRMAWFFDESPVPEGLNKEELKEYKSQIDSFAQEYYQQIHEYEKMLSVLVGKEVEVAKAKLPVPNNLDKWNRNITPTTLIADGELKRKSPMRAHIILDAQKELGKITAEDHARWRGYIILNLFPHQFASNYLQDELFAYNQNKVISDWGKLVGYTLSDRKTASEEKDK